MAGAGAKRKGKSGFRNTEKKGDKPQVFNNYLVKEIISCKL